METENILIRSITALFLTEAKTGRAATLDLTFQQWLTLTKSGPTKQSWEAEFSVKLINAVKRPSMIFTVCAAAQAMLKPYVSYVRHFPVRLTDSCKAVV